MLDGFIRVGAVSPKLKVGNTLYNGKEIISLIRKAVERKVKILVFPELAITGYTSQDLFFNRTLLQGAREALDEIIEATKGVDILLFVGYPFEYSGKLYNTSAVIQDGNLLSIIPKRNIPQYGEFYEERWFNQSMEENILLDNGTIFGRKVLFKVKEMPSCVVGCEICEDLWALDSPSVECVRNGATIIVNLSSSNEIVGKSEYRRELVKVQSAKEISGYIYSSSGEGESSQDMVFTGHNIIAEDGVILSEKTHSLDEIIYSEIDTDYLISEREKHNTFMSESSFSVIDISFKKEETPLSRKISTSTFVPEEKGERKKRSEEILLLQSLGLKKRMESIGCKNVVLGISGGLDSTLALLVAIETFSLLSLPLKNIHSYSLPCFGTGKRTKSNAEKLALSLGVDFHEVDISKSVLSHFRDIEQDENCYSSSYENAQARERTQFLMDKANMLNAIVLGTGDLSELALGWCTFNGDHMANYAVNGSLPKTAVKMVVDCYKDKTKNKELKVVLEDILNTPISPELIPPKDGKEQNTEETLGRYELHDFFLYYFVRRSFSPRKIYRLALYSFGEENEEEIYNSEKIFIKRFFSSQFKRSTLPDGPKVGSVSLSPRSDWRMSSDTDFSIFLEDLEKNRKKCN